MLEGQNKQAAFKVFTYKGVTNPGDRILPIYKRVWDDAAKKDVVKKTSESDIYEMIQEANNTSDINQLKKMINGGQIEAPEDPMAVYGQDLGNYPSSIHEVYDRVNHGEEAFKALSPELQQYFGSYSNWENALLSGTYESELQKYFNKALEDAKAVTEKKEGNEE